ncbi:SLC13 family permease [Aridibaculum aurantiacum]|uniref:SLC13 family permease n=1 Tax=Aridibaculum aurantiacum TaxID=2810307 RepID=UPI001A95F44B|nr:DASS family sodium-coupled anion symporter [Aridibaculum aurantiacum]
MPSNRKFWISIFSAAAIFFYLLFGNPFNVEPTAAKVLAIGGLMITLWVTEAAAMPVVALLPLILFPAMGIATIDETATPYANPVIFLFMGGFMIGLAIEKWNLHRRIALNIVKVTGTSGDRIVLGFIIAAGFLSMWLSNTATTMMMFPIAASVITVMKDNDDGKGSIQNFAVTIMLAIAYAANLGGIATIIGTPPNVAFAAFIQKKYNYTIEFLDWMMICLPIALLLLTALYFVMVKWMYPNKIASSDATKKMIHLEIKALGKIGKAESRVLVIFAATALLWITKDLINRLGVIALNDTMIAVMGAVALFLTPSGEKNPEEKFVLQWRDTTKMAWGILLLFGGGITLANQMEKAGLIGMMGTWLAGFSGSGGFILVLMIALIAVFLSELMSNVAQVIVFAPVIAGMADVLTINPLLLGIPMTLGASCAGMLPMGTPPNAIVFSSGHIRLKDMLKVGFVVNILSVILIALFCYYLVPMIVPELK